MNADDKQLLSIYNRAKETGHVGILMVFPLGDDDGVTSFFTVLSVAKLIRDDVTRGFQCNPFVVPVVTDNTSKRASEIEVKPLVVDVKKLKELLVAVDKAGGCGT